MNTNFLLSASKTRNWLKENQYPYTDNVLLKNSGHHYENGALYGVEIPIINSLAIMEKTIKYIDKYAIPCDRFNETKGSFLLSDSEIKQMLELSVSCNIGITFSLSPRPEYDTKSSFYFSKFGMEQCRKLNNIDAIVASLDEAVRLSEMGCRGLIVYDIGVLHLLNKMRLENKISKNMCFITSSHMMTANPIIAKILSDLGANSSVTIHDASLVVLQEMRRLCNQLILDVPIDVYKDKGGYIRYNEIAEIVQVSSPVMLKLGAGAQNNPYDNIDETVIENRVKNASIAIEHLKRTLDDDTFHKRIPKKHACLPSLSF